MLRDADKTYVDAETNQALKLSSGLAFVEFSDPEIALYVVRYLNNMQLAG